jgi:hypothetical protein
MMFRSLGVLNAFFIYDTFNIQIVYWKITLFKAEKHLYLFEGGKIFLIN